MMGSPDLSFEASKRRHPDVVMEKRPHPGGAMGSKVSLEEVGKRGWAARLDTDLAAWVGRTLVAAGNPKSIRGKVQALLDEYRKKTIYGSDPAQAERMVAPKYQLCLVDGGICFPIRDCDDGTIVMLGACLSIDIACKVVGQAFTAEEVDRYNRTRIATHVLLAIQDEDGNWLRVEPSSDDYGVGDFYPATQEWWFDPSAAPNVDVAGAGGDFVGVGRPQGLGGVEEVIANNLESAIGMLATSVFGLGAALITMDGVRGALGGGYDPEASTGVATSVANFPEDGRWTESMAAVSRNLWAIGNTLMGAAVQAREGTRKILVDKDKGDAYFEFLDGDPWHLMTIATSTTEGAVMMFLDPGGTILSGLTAKGTALAVDEVKAILASGKTGAPPSRLGLAPIVIGLIVAGAVLAAIAQCYIIAKLCDTATAIAKESTRKKILECVLQGKCTPEQGAALEKVQDEGRVAEKKAEADASKVGLFGTDWLEKAGNVLTVAVVGGVVIGGLVLFAPLLRTAVEEWQASRRFARDHQKKDAA